jgi:dTDP-4-dehydrorhamnose reductase
LRALITGGAGVLGQALLASAPTGAEVHATWRGTALAGPRAHPVELSEEGEVSALLARVRPEVVIHTAYSVRDLERDVVRASLNVARCAAELGARLIHLSSDMVFGGEDAPYGEGDPPAPITDYGRAKLRAEQAAAEAGGAVVRTALIVRTQGEDATVRALRTGTLPAAFADELRSPLADVDLARQLWEMAALPTPRLPGIWHLAGPEAVSRYTLAVLLALHAGLDPTPIRVGWNRDFTPRRPRDLRMLTPRADRELSTRARPISEVLADRVSSPGRPGSAEDEPRSS